MLAPCARTNWHFFYFNSLAHIYAVDERTGKMTSPIKSLSIREGVDGSLCIHKKVKPGLYNSVADFWFKICVFVKCEDELNSCSGYILNVHKVQGERRVSK